MLSWYGEQETAKRELAKIYLSRVRKLLFSTAFFQFDPLDTQVEKDILNLSLNTLNSGNKYEVENLTFYFLELARTLFEKSAEKDFHQGSLNAFAKNRSAKIKKRFGSGREKNFEDLEDFLQYLLEVSVEQGDTEIQKLIEKTEKSLKTSE